MSNILYLDQLQELDDMMQDEIKREAIACLVTLAKVTPYPYNKYWLERVRSEIKQLRNDNKRVA